MPNETGWGILTPMSYKSENIKLDYNTQTSPKNLKGWVLRVSVDSYRDEHYLILLYTDTEPTSLESNKSCSVSDRKVEAYTG